MVLNIFLHCELIYLCVHLYITEIGNFYKVMYSDAFSQVCSTGLLPFAAHEFILCPFASPTVWIEAILIWVPRSLSRV